MGKPSNAFQGHFDPNDPRYILTAAGGCTWPTIPAHRYLMVSDNATGAWATLNVSGAVFQRTSPPTVHDDCTWGLFHTLAPWTWAYLRREYFRINDEIRWRVEIHTIFCYFPTVAYFFEEPGKCNGEVQLGAMSCIPAPGSTGSHLKLLPVQWDKLTAE